MQEVLQLDWGRAFLNVHALQVVTASDANVKSQIISAIVAVIVAIAVRIYKKALPYFPIH